MLEEIGVFYRGLVLGLVIAAPVGPIGLLCIRRTIQKGLVVGFITGLGAAVADTLFSIVAVLGVTVVLDFIRNNDVYIRVLGGAIILFGAWHTWHDKPKPPPTDPAALANKVIGMAKEDTLMGSLKGFVSGFAITMTNPLTMFGILAVVATFGELQNRLETTTLVTGIFFGSTLWWLILSGGIALVRGHFTENRVVLINRITAVLLAILAIWAIASGVMRHLSPPAP